MLVHVEPHFLHDGDHLGAQVMGAIDRRNREVATLDTRTVAQVALVEEFARYVRAFFGSELEEGGIRSALINAVRAATERATELGKID